jgi:NADH-quinone oxidoreductase subunit F
MKPPFPAVEGLYASPTVVNNVETLTAVPQIIEMGGEAWQKLGNYGRARNYRTYL